MDRQQLRRAAGQTIRLGDHQHVTLPQKGQALSQATVLGDARNLLGEHLLSASGSEIAILRGEAGRLIAASRPICLLML
jgi:hypothetical protein